MSSTTQSREESSSTNFDAIEEAFYSVWQTLYANVAEGNSQAEELKIQLSQNTHQPGFRRHNRSEGAATQGAGEHGTHSAIEDGRLRH